MNDFMIFLVLHQSHERGSPEVVRVYRTYEQAESFIRECMPNDELSYHQAFTIEQAVLR